MAIEKVSQEEYEKEKKQSKDKEDEKIDFEVMSAEEFEERVNNMDSPVLAQKELAVQVKKSLDKRIEDELRERGILSESTRKWVETLNNILEKLQKSLHGDKSVNLHLHKISHSDISAAIRKNAKDRD